MSSIPDFTILVALDREHLAEFAVSYPTWIRHKPELRERPIVFVCDKSRVCGVWNSDIASICFDHKGELFRCEAPLVDGMSQREKMLTALVNVGPKYVGDSYYLKLDSDLIATGCEDWIDSTWFRDSPAVIASPWGYTKPAGMLESFDKWADTHPKHFGALRIEKRIVGNVAKHRRIISYCMFGRTDWTRQMAELAGERLPCPSQDTFLGGCAVRGGELIRYAPMKDLGWQHVGGGGRRLREAAAAAMEGAIS